MLKILEIKPGLRKMTMKNSMGRIKCIKKESKFVRHYQNMLDANIPEIPEVCLRDGLKLEGIDIMDIDTFVVYDIDTDIADINGDTIKFNLETGKYINVRRRT